MKDNPQYIGKMPIDSKTGKDARPKKKSNPPVNEKKRKKWACWVKLLRILRRNEYARQGWKGSKEEKLET